VLQRTATILRFWDCHEKDDEGAGDMDALRAYTQKEILPFNGKAGFLASLGLAMGIVLAAMPAQAAQPGSSGRLAVNSVKEKATAVAVKDPETTSSIEGDLDANCASSRKRLFVESEGWIVRRVTTCY
jgi:hypothetical protein